MVFLKQVLKENDFIKELVLSWNLISAKGGLILAEGVQENDSLAVLDLAYNNLGEKSGFCLGQKLL